MVLILSVKENELVFIIDNIHNIKPKNLDVYPKLKYRMQFLFKNLNIILFTNCIYKAYMDHLTSRQGSSNNCSN